MEEHRTRAEDASSGTGNSILSNIYSSKRDTLERDVDMAELLFVRCILDVEFNVTIYGGICWETCTGISMKQDAQDVGHCWCIRMKGLRVVKQVVWCRDTASMAVNEQEKLRWNEEAILTFCILL